MIRDAPAAEEHRLRRAGSGVSRGGGSLPAAARTARAVLLESWFTDAVATTFVVTVALASIGGPCALLPRSDVVSQDNADSRDGVSAAVVEP
jgi:hypothetical protein